MTPRQIRLLQESWAQVAPISHEAAALFYRRLFELDPAIRPLFKNDMVDQGRKLVGMITIVVNGLDYLDELLPAVVDLGRRHLEYRVTERMYDTVGESLLWALGQGLGAGFTADVEEAWATTYNSLAEIMKSAAYTRV